MMKRIYLVVLICSFSIRFLSAQELTLEYNAGFGTYKMNDLKGWLDDTKPPFNHIKITDNFPGYLTHQGKIGMEWRRIHQAGLMVDFMNTVGNKGVSDYSAAYNFTIRVKGIRLGTFYRFSLPDLAESLVRPYLQFSTGVVLNNGEAEQVITLAGESKEVLESVSYKGANFFIEPTVGVKFRIHERFALNLSAGYEFDLTKKFTYRGETAMLAPDWSGFRFQGGLIFYVPLTTKK